MLTETQSQRYAQTGLLALPGAIPSADADRMLTRLWDSLSTDHGFDRDRPQTWTPTKVRHLQALTHAGAFNAMASAQVRGALDGLLGAGGWHARRGWGTPLITFPDASARWEVPTVSWHAGDAPGTTVFVFLAEVRPHGGGTLVVEGSHRLVERFCRATGNRRSVQIKAGLGRLDPWLHDLWSGRPGQERNRRYLEDGVTIGGLPLIVQELTGEPGDVVLMHNRCLHAPAPNTGHTPRMMLVEHVAAR